MKYVLSILLCFTMLASSAQKIDDRQLKENIAKLDSQAKDINESVARSMHSMDSINMARSNEQMGRNMSRFVADRREQEKKQLKQTYLRLAFGVLMLIVLIAGLVRRRKQKK